MSHVSDVFYTPARPYAAQIAPSHISMPNQATNLSTIHLNPGASLAQLKTLYE